MAGSRKPLQISKWLPRTHLIVRIQPWEPSSPSPHTSRLATIITQKHCRGACVCPVQRNSRTEKTVSHNAVRRKNRLTEKTHASGKTKKCLSWHPSQWRMGRFGGTVESFWRQAVVFWAWEGLKRLIQWSAEVPGVHVTLELPSCWLSCCHWDCYTLFILIQIAKPWQNQMSYRRVSPTLIQAVHWWSSDADLSPSVHRSLVSPVQSDTH